MALRGVATELAADVGEDDDWKLESLGLVCRHQPHPVGAFLEDRRLGCRRALGGVAQLADEAAERQPAFGLVAAGELGDLQDIGEHLLAAAPQHEAGVRAGESRSAG